MMLTIVELRKKNISDIKIVIIIERFIKVAYIVE